MQEATIIEMAKGSETERVNDCRSKIETTLTERPQPWELEMDIMDWVNDLYETIGVVERKPRG